MLRRIDSCLPSLLVQHARGCPESPPSQFALFHQKDPRSEPACVEALSEPCWIFSSSGPLKTPEEMKMPFGPQIRPLKRRTNNKSPKPSAAAASDTARGSGREARALLGARAVLPEAYRRAIDTRQGELELLLDTRQGCHRLEQLMLPLLDVLDAREERGLPAGLPGGLCPRGRRRRRSLLHHHITISLLLSYH